MKRTLKIVLVEDNPGDILLAEEVLEDLDLNFELKILTHGEEAINYLSLKTKSEDVIDIDLIFLDINLPRKSGHEVLEFIRSQRTLKDIAVYMLTTSSAAIDRSRSKSNKASGYFTKPIDQKALEKTINSDVIPKLQKKHELI